MDETFSESKTDALAFPVYPFLLPDKTDEGYKQNIADWTKVLRKYQEGLEWCASQGAKHYEDRHKERGLLLGMCLYCMWRDLLERGIEFIYFLIRIHRFWSWVRLRGINLILHRLLLHSSRELV